MTYPRSNSTVERVVVTGLGIVTSLGLGCAANAEGFQKGHSAIRPVRFFDVSRQRTRLAAEVELPAALPRTHLSAKDEGRADRAAKLLLHAAFEAWTQAGWASSEDLPLVLGTTSGGMRHGQDYLRQLLAEPLHSGRQASRVAHYNAQQQALTLCDALGFQGPVTIIANACASGANAIGMAFDLVRKGRSERVLTGGYDALCELTFAGFDSLQALSSTPCRPFHAERDGLSIGEGAGVLALESLNHARKRGAEILGEITGYGASTDNHHLTQPHPQGDAALAAMTLACADAGITAAEVDYVNAHGTATPHNDSAEAAAINRWAAESAPRMSVSSTKSAVGHLLGAAGAVEAVVSLMALRGGWRPPQRVAGAIDPACLFRIVDRAEESPINVAISNSFGFGGANASLVFRRWT